MSEATSPSAPPRPMAGRLTFFPSNVTSQNNFGLLRLALSVLVVFCHSFGISGSGRHDPLESLTHGLIDSGGLAVDCFFTISGFLIASSWLQTSDLWAYLKKRSLRIFPGLVAVVLFCILVVGPLAGVNLAEYFRNPETYRFAQVLLLRDAFSVKGMAGVFHTNPFPNFVDGSLWTIRYEVLCYLLLPLLALVGLLKRRWLLLGVFLCLLGAFHHYGTGFGIGALNHSNVAWSSSLDNLPRLIIFFLAGVIFYVWRENIPRSPALVLLALVILVLTRGHNTGMDTYFRRLNLYLPLAGTYIVFYLAYAESLLPRLTRLAQRHDLSYGVYLYGFPIQQLLAHYAQLFHVPFLQTMSGMFIAATLITLGLASLSWRYIEQPCLRLKASRRAQTAAETSMPAPNASMPVPTS